MYAPYEDRPLSVQKQSTWTAGYIPKIFNSNETSAFPLELTAEQLNLPKSSLESVFSVKKAEPFPLAASVPFSKTTFTMGVG